MKKLFASLIGFMLLFSFNSIAGQLGDDVGSYELFKPVARTQVVGTYGSKVVDRKEFGSAVALLQSAKSSAGTSCSLHVVIQESDATTRGNFNNYAATDTASRQLRVDSTQMRIAEQILQLGARQLSSITIKLKKVGTITSGKKVWLQIETDNTGAPSMTLVHADAVDSIIVDSIGTSDYAWKTFSFLRPVDLADSGVYHIVLRCNYAVSSSNYIKVYGERTVTGGGIETLDSTGAAKNWYDSAAVDLVGWNLQYNFANFASDSFTVVTESADVFSTLDINLRPRKQYLRAKASIVGTSASFVSCGTLILGEPKHKPVTD
jgi:hypothetical protein